MKPIKEIQEAKPSKEILGEIAELEGYVKGNISGMEDRYGYYLEYFNDIQELIYEYELLCNQLIFVKREYDKIKTKYDDMKDDYTIARAYAINNILKGDRNDK